MIRDIVIYGAGGLGREIALMLDQMNKAVHTWRLVGFFDDGIDKGTIVSGVPVLGGLKELNETSLAYGVAIAIADPMTRKKIVSALSNDKIYFPVLAHPGALLGSETNFFGKGTIIAAHSILTTGIVLGEFVIINLTATIGHDAKIGSFCTLMPGCHISGTVQLGEESQVGTGAQVLQNLQLGPRTIIGAGAVVTKSFMGEVTIVGVPGRAQ